jgi:hypothetical protein
MKDLGESVPVSEAGASTGEIGERLAIRMMLAGLISYHAATSANGHMPATSIVAEFKRIMGTTIEALDIQVKTASEEKDPIVMEEEIRRAALDFLESTFACVKI